MTKAEIETLRREKNREEDKQLDRLLSKKKRGVMQSHERIEKIQRKMDGRDS